MSAPVEPVAVATTGNGSAVGRPGPPTTPIAVVWCRQVDNEAESPGYTTVPEEFPGHRETLDVIRIVGNLTVNVADTHDYWDPDPAQPLSYYPNLFLYPAFGGRYTCVGRMFLSTEDRPRLGMKTLVLDTAQLLASGEFGTNVLRWHASMGGPRRDGSRPPPVPDASLYAMVGEGFLFHRGATDPVLLVVSDEWEAAMQAILDLVRVLPASLVGLGAILAFPYFLPQPKTDLHEFTEQIPLSLALMRVGHGEAAGDRHARRLAAWEDSHVTVRDLTGGVPAAPGRGKETVPLVLQYLRDHNEVKLGPIVQRVDFVELGRLKKHLADPDRQSGKDRRKEMWRIGTAMESAALLLQRARGRHVPVNVETAKRAQEYLQARVPAAESELEGDAAVVAPSPPPPLEIPPPGQHPPWLQRAVEPVVSVPRADRVEVVPVSVSDDPSLYRSDPPISSLAAPDAESADPGPSAPPAVPVRRIPGMDAAQLKLDIQRDLLRFVDERLASLQDRSVASLSAKIGDAVDARTTPKLVDLERTQREEVERALADLEHRLNERIEVLAGSAALATLESRLVDRMSDAANASAAVQTEGAQSLRSALDRRLSDTTEAQSKALMTAVQQLRQRIAEAEQRVGQRASEQSVQSESRAKDAIAPIVQAEVERRLRQQIDPRLAEAQQRSQETLTRSAEAIRVQIKANLEAEMTKLKEHAAMAEADLRAGLVAQLELHLAEAADRDVATRDATEAQVTEKVAQRFAEQDARRAKELRDLDSRLLLLVDGRSREALDKVQSLAAEQHAKLTEILTERLEEAGRRSSDALDARMTQVQDGQLHGMADLQVRLQSYFEQKLREAQDRERETYLELLARLKGEVEAQIPRLLDSPKMDAPLRERIQRSLETLRGETQRVIDQKIAQAEDRLKTDLDEGLHRIQGVEAQLGDRGKEMVRLEESIRSDLDELERRTAVISDRLVPVVRRTWQRIGELEKAHPKAADSDLKFNQVRREFNRELRRVEGELAERTAEIRDRMETAIGNQGKVWLTLIRQLSQLTEDRRALEERKLQPPSLAPRVNPMDPEAPDETATFDEIDSYLAAASKGRETGGRRPTGDATPPTDDPTDEGDRAGRRRPRRSPR